MHLETISWSATAPGASGAAAAAVTGDSLTIKNGKGKNHILNWWGNQQADGFQQIVFPSGHDTTRNFRADIDTAQPEFRLSNGIGMGVESQELMSITIAGSATAGDVEMGSALVLYDDLPGVDGRYIRWSELVRRADKLTTVYATLTGAAAGYTGSELITSESNLLRANRDYAVLGMTSSDTCGSICISGPDTAYQRCSLPGNVDNSQVLQEGFCLLARAYDRALIPVINSGNRESTFLSFTQNENNISPEVTLYLALLDK